MLLVFPPDRTFAQDIQATVFHGRIQKRPQVVNGIKRLLGFPQGQEHVLHRIFRFLLDFEELQSVHHHGGIVIAVKRVKRFPAFPFEPFYQFFFLWRHIYYHKIASANISLFHRVKALPL